MKGGSAPGGGRRNTNAPGWTVVIIVRSTVTREPLGVTLGGANEQDAPIGRFVHPKATDWLNPFSGVTVMVYFADPPGTMVSRGGVPASL